MNRCTQILFTVAAAGAISLANAQTEEPQANIRQFPKDAKRGELVVLAAPDISMDGRPDRMSPGVRIRDSNNHLVLSGAVTNQRLTVNYVRDNTGLVQNVWVLNAEEIKQKMPGQRDGILSNLRSMFDAPEVKDDGKTPFDQLPKYKE
jgi:hypothetical protein